MPADAYVMDADMKKVADAIRTKGETTGQLTFPDGMVTAIQNMKTADYTIEDGLIAGTLKNLTNDRVTSIKDYGFYRDNSLVTISLPNAVSVGFNGFREAKKLNSVNFPKVNSSLPLGAFSGCNELISVNMPNATAIEQSVFNGCGKLKSADFPKVTSVGDYSFEKCKGLERCNFPNLVSIGREAFSFTSLSYVSLPKVTSFGDLAFSYTNNLKTVILGASQVVSAGANVFYVSSDLVQIYVPNHLVDDYKVATNWSQYASRIHPMSEAPSE